MISDTYRDRLQTILNDQLILDAIRAVFDEVIEQEKPRVVEGEDNIVLGQKYRAYEKAKQLLEKGFIDLTGYKNYKLTGKNFNKAR